MKKLLSALLITLGGSAEAKIPTFIVGEAAYYSDSYEGSKMSDGHAYRKEGYTCACWDFPLGAKLLVQYTSRAGFIRSVVVTNTDRGPSRELRRRNRVIDLSRAAFRVLENPAVGVVTVSIQEVL